MGGFKGTDMNLTAGNAALAKRIAELTGQEFRKALAEDRMIRAGLAPEWATGQPV